MPRNATLDAAAFARQDQEKSRVFIRHAISYLGKTVLRELFRSFKVIAIVLLIPALPFLLFGSQMDAWAAAWRASPPAKPVVAGVIISLLATDIFLPIPSSVINTLAGYELGVLAGTVACWLGMSIGAILGFALAKRWGQPFALWLTKESDLARMRWLSERYGPGVLILTRGVPILAEASVLLMGIHDLSWRRFLLPVLLSNLALAFAYAKFGEFAEHNEWLPLAICASIAIPVVLTAIVQWWLSKKERSRHDET